MAVYSAQASLYAEQQRYTDNITELLTSRHVAAESASHFQRMINGNCSGGPSVVLSDNGSGYVAWLPSVDGKKWATITESRFLQVGML